MKVNIKDEIINEAIDDKRCDPLQDNYIHQSLNDACFMTELNSIILKKWYNEIVQLNVVHKEEQTLIHYFDVNKKGNDYVVGDLHCQFDKLDNQLKEIAFNKEKDRLFCVGDLIDRGKNGYRVLEYLKEDWFFSILGNHEEMIMTFLSMPDNFFNLNYKLAMQNGSQWLNEDKKLARLLTMELLVEARKEKDRKEKDRLTFEQLMAEFPLLKIIYYAFTRLPYVIQIGKDIALVHAEVPMFIEDWKDLIDKVNDLHIDTLESLLWGRMRIESDINKEVKGIKKIYCGHTILEKPDKYGNHFCIDIGAYVNEKRKLHIEKINHD